MAGLMRSHRRLALEHANRAVGMVTEELAGDGEPDDAAPDDRQIASLRRW
jgi:hypothetical protein